MTNHLIAPARRIGLWLPILSLLAVSSASASSFSAVTDYSLVTNVASNTWSYWGETPSTTVATYPGSIALLPTFFNDCGSNTKCWDASDGSNNLVLQNATGADVSFPGSDARNNQLTFYTRTGISLVRFLVPTSGSYDLTGFFEGSALPSETSQEFIAVNGNVGSPLLNLTLFGTSSFGIINPFSFSNLSLSAGDTVDFLVAGRSTISTTNSLATGFNATFRSSPVAAPVPEPASLFLLGTGLVGVVARRRRARL